MGRTSDISTPRPAGGVAPSSFDEALDGGRAPLPYRERMEHLFGADFGTVRVFLGRAEALRTLGVPAATRGEDIVFAADRPTFEQVAHELTHVLQHRRGPAPDRQLSDPGDAAEREAVRLAALARAGHRVRVTRPAAALIQCAWPDDLSPADRTTLAGQQVPARFAHTWQSPVWRPIYERWARRNHLQEGPAFLAEVEEYRRNPTPAILTRLHATYLVAGAPQQVNIGHATMTGIDAAVQGIDAPHRRRQAVAIPRGIFDPAYDEIFTMLDTNYPAFRTDALANGGHP